VQSSRAQVEQDPRGEAGRDAGAATSVVVTSCARVALESPRVREWMAWRRYLISTRTSSGLAVYPRNEEDAWARLVEDLAQAAEQRLGKGGDGFRTARASRP
jgi:hypothetical protein